jgi:CRISPR-associated protein Csd2
MSSLKNKIDFAIIIQVKNANPNGDPLNGNRPRTDYSGFGEITDVCLKRKIRDRLIERYLILSEGEKAGQSVFVQSDDRKIDEAKSLKERAEKILGSLDARDTIARACKEWIDVRTFGQLFAFSGTSKTKKSKKPESTETESDGDTGVSIPIRGPVSVQSAFSIEPICLTSTQITKSVSGDGDGKKKASDTMGMKHRVDYGIYVTYGSMNPQLAERTGFSEQDAEVIKSILPKLFENDASSARPEGSIQVLKVIWWKHNCKSGQYSSAKVHKTLDVKSDGSCELQDLDGLIHEDVLGF